MARTIDEKFPALKETQPEVLAHHWTEAGETEPAIAEWTRAGEVARAHNAFNEALASCQLALALLDLLPESPDATVADWTSGNRWCSCFMLRADMPRPRRARPPRAPRHWRRRAAISRSWLVGWRPDGSSLTIRATCPRRVRRPMKCSSSPRARVAPPV